MEVKKSTYVPGIGSSSSKIAIIGEAPGYEENKTGIPFSGPAGRLLDSMLREAGLSREQVYLTNVVKYQPPNNDFKRISEVGVKLEESIQELRKELETLNPNVLVPLGNNALEAVTGHKGISKYRGSVLSSVLGSWKCIPTIHPRFLLWKSRDKKATSSNEGSEISQQVIIADFIKIERESHFPELRAIPRSLRVVTSPFQLQQWIDSYKSDYEVSLDIETHKGIPTCIGLAFTPYDAISVPLLNIPGRDGGINLPQTDLVEIYIILQKFLNNPRLKFVGQNFKFDHDKLVSISRILNPGAGKLAADTSLMMGVCYTEFKKNLAFMASIFTNEPFWKDEGKEFNPKKDDAKRLLLYNAKDAAVTMEIKLALDKELDDFSKEFNRDLKGFYYNHINKFHDFYMDIEAEGLDVDIERREELKKDYDSKILAMQLELHELVGHELNVKSPTQVKKLLFVELGLPIRDNAQEDTLVALMGNHTIAGSKESRILHLILQIRQARTNRSYLEAQYDQDGRMRTTYRITGTETGRTSTGTLGSPIRPWDSGMAFQTIPKHGPYASAIRGIFIPPPGYLFLEVDLSQAEARIVALLAEDSNTLELFNTTDIHSVTASWIFNKDPKEITSDERFIGKTSRHAGNYGMGKHRLMMSVNADAKKFGIPVQLSEKEADHILKTFHARTPKIRGVFQREVKAEVASSRTLFNPFGRMRQFFGDIKDEELFAQLPQSTVSDHLRAAGLRIKSRLPSIRICLEAHDAFLFKVKEDEVEQVAKLVKEEMERAINFSSCSLPRGELVIPAEAKVGKRYSELKKL